MALDELLLLLPLLRMAVAHHAPTTELFERLENLLVGRARPTPEACILNGGEESLHLLLILRTCEKRIRNLLADAVVRKDLPLRFWDGLIPPLCKSSSEALQRFLLDRIEPLRRLFHTVQLIQCRTRVLWRFLKG